MENQMNENMRHGAGEGGSIQGGLNPFDLGKSSSSYRGLVTKLPDELTARTAYSVLDGVESKNIYPGTTSKVLKALQEEGLIEAVPAYTVSKLAILADGVAQQKRTLEAYENSWRLNRQSLKVLHEIEGSWLKKASIGISSLLGFHQEPATPRIERIRKLESTCNTLAAQCSSLKEEIAEGNTAASSLASLTRFENEGYFLKNPGKELLLDLRDTQTLLGTFTLREFSKGIAQIDSQLRARIDRAKEFLVLFGDSGFSVKTPSVKESIVNLSASPGTQLEVLQSAATIDGALAKHTLTEPQRVHLISTLLGGDRITSDAVQRFEALVEELKGDKKATYKDLYVAAQLAHNPGDPKEQAARFKDVCAELADLGLKESLGITIHTAARLASYSKDALPCFTSHLEALKKSGIRDIADQALTSLALMRIDGEISRKLEITKGVTAALTVAGLRKNSDKDGALIAAIAGVPGTTGPKVRMLRKAFALIQEGEKDQHGLGRASLQGALTICAGALNDIAGSELLGESERSVASHLCGVDSKALSNARRTRREDLAGSSTPADSSFYPGNPYYGGDGGYAPIFDLGHTGHPAAVCGSNHHSPASSHDSSGSGHGHGHSDGGHSHTNSACSTGHHTSCGSSHSSCSGGHSSCGGGGSSCGGGSGCGGGGCGGS